MTTLLLTFIVVGSGLALLGISLILTGRNRVHGSCAATNSLNVDDVESCDFCPHDEQEDRMTTLAKAGYPGRRNVISEEAYQGRKRNLAVEKLKYHSGRE